MSIDCGNTDSCEAGDKPEECSGDFEAEFNSCEETDTCDGTEQEQHTVDNQQTETYSVTEDYPLEEEELEALYNDIDTFISEGVADAEEEGKPLLIIIGEDHGLNPDGSRNVENNNESLLAQQLIYLSAASNNINNILFEGPEDLLNFIKDFPAEEDPYHFADLVDAAQELDMSFAALDDDINANNSVRQRQMIETILQYGSPTIVLIGAFHMNDLVNDPELQQNFHVISFNAANLTIEESEIISVQGHSDDIEWLIDPSNSFIVDIPGNVNNIDKLDLWGIATVAASYTP